MTRSAGGSALVGEEPDGEGSVGAGVVDLPVLAVADESGVAAAGAGGDDAAVAGSVGQDPVDFAGDDAVAAAGGQAVGEGDAVGVDLAEGDEFGAGLPVEFGDGGVVRGDEQAGAAVGGVGAPVFVGGGDHVGAGAVGEAVVVLVGVQSGGFAEPDLGGGEFFPGSAGAVGIAEPADLRQGRGVGAVGGQQSQGAAGVDRGQLVRVADQQQLRPGGGDLAGEPVQSEGAGHAGLVHDQQIAGAQPPPVDLRPDRFDRSVQPVGAAAVRGGRWCGCPAGRCSCWVRSSCRPASASHFATFSVSQAQVGGEHCRRLGGGGQRPHGARAVDGFPDGADPGHGGGFPGPGRAEQHVDALARRW